MRLGQWLCVAGLGLVLTASAGCDVVDVQAASAEGSVERTLTVSGPVDLEVRTGSGDIQIRPGTDGSVHLVGRITARDAAGDKPEARIAQIQAHPPVEQSGNTIRIGLTHDDPLYRNVRITYELTVPTHTKVQARSGSGNIGVAFSADAVDARTGSGDINVLGSGGSFDASTGSGDVRAGRIAGPMKALTGSGKIEAAPAGKDAVETRTGSGDVTLSLDENAAVNLNVHTGSGSIRTNLPVTVASRGRNRLEGTVRGGGARVYVRTGSGSVTIN